LTSNVIPVDLHRIGGIAGAGAGKRLSAVRWGVAKNIVWAWVLTIPAAGCVAAAVWSIAQLVTADASQQVYAIVLNIII